MANSQYAIMLNLGGQSQILVISVLYRRLYLYVHGLHAE